MCSGPENSSSILSQVEPGGAGGPLNLVASCLSRWADGHRLLYFFEKYCDCGIALHNIVVTPIESVIWHSQKWPEFARIKLPNWPQHTAAPRPTAAVVGTVL